MWTFQIVQAHDEQYCQVFRDVSALVRGRLSAGLPHMFEAEMKHLEQTAGSIDQTGR